MATSLMSKNKSKNKRKLSETDIETLIKNAAHASKCVKRTGSGTLRKDCMCLHVLRESRLRGPVVEFLCELQGKHKQETDQYLIDLYRGNKTRTKTNRGNKTRKKTKTNYYPIPYSAKAVKSKDDGDLLKKTEICTNALFALTNIRKGRWKGIVKAANGLGVAKPHGNQRKGSIMEQNNERKSKSMQHIISSIEVGDLVQRSITTLGYTHINQNNIVENTSRKKESERKQPRRAVKDLPSVCCQCSTECNVGSCSNVDNKIECTDESCGVSRRTPGKKCNNRLLTRKTYLSCCGPVEEENRGLGLKVLSQPLGETSIPVGGVIGQYIGRIIEGVNDCPNCNYKFECSDEQVTTKCNWICSCKEGNLLRFMNHSCTPNCRQDFRQFSSKENGIYFWATRDIEVGEFLSIDYTGCMHQHETMGYEDLVKAMKNLPFGKDGCKCNSSTCISALIATKKNAQNQKRKNKKSK